MGVQGLWSLVGPAARPVQLESLRERKLAIDASIWIHQFMRTMRDKDGNALRNGHLLGFFRRLCKLLFYNIKPVFVFDGGAPVLKRRTIIERRKRREGIVTNMRRTAEKIINAQVKSQLLLNEEKRRKHQNTADKEQEEYVYFDQLNQSAAVEELRQKRMRDQFELPPITETAGDTAGLREDPRLATAKELQDFISEFQPSAYDIDSEAFHALPPEMQYEIIQDLKVKSRQTSWARLDEMLKQSTTALDFSKQQIKHLVHRNEMTQRALQMTGIANRSDTLPTRVAGERSREYILVKNENVEQGLGWQLPGMNEQNVPKVPMKSESQERRVYVEKNIIKEEADKVKEAIAGNPTLAALFAQFESDEDDQSIVNSDESDDEEPLFLQPHTSIIRDPDPSYVEEYISNEDAIAQVISKIYHEQLQQVDQQPEESADIIETEEIPNQTPDDYYNFWLSRVPDAFIYTHSLNDEYKRILHDVVYTMDEDTLALELKKVQKKHGKASNRDPLALESLAFMEHFLKSTLSWRQAQTQSPVAETPEIVYETISADKTQALEATSMDIPSIPGTVQSSSPETQRSPATTESPLPSQGGFTNELETHTISIQHDDHASETEDTASLQSKDMQHIDNELDVDDIINDTQEPYENSNYEMQQQDHSHAENKSATDVDEHKQQLIQGYNSDEDLIEGHEAEESEFARFVSDIADKDIEVVRQDLVQDMRELNSQHRKEMANAEEVTPQITQEIQELLQLFGVPYIVSPMEAEAQCAKLVDLSLVDGIVTDDSDVFLFGGDLVYKNMFNQQKYVECYSTQDIEREMQLDRKRLVQLAFLLGSDYTDGIPGIGPVAAMEILDEFSESDDERLEAPLERFRAWYESKKDDTLFQRKLRKKHGHLEIPDDFPSKLVVDAYYHPLVDESQQPFSWGIPQLDMLRIFLMESFAWSEQKTDEVLIPVIREMNKRKSVGRQSSISSFFEPSTTGPANLTTPRNRQAHGSKRVQSIVDRWRNEKATKRTRRT